MEIFTKKSIVLKIVIALVIVILFNFSAPTISNAGIAEVIGGTLLTPIMTLVTAIADRIFRSYTRHDYGNRHDFSKGYSK